jgi:hypothetical protein
LVVFQLHTCHTPSTWEQQNKCIHITQTANSPSQQIQLLSSHGHNNDNSPSVDIPAAQNLFQTKIASNPNPIADVFGDPDPVSNHVNEMDIDEIPHHRSPCHPPAQIIAREQHAGGQNIRGRIACEAHPNNVHLL